MFGYGLAVLCSLGLILAAVLQLAPLSIVETLGFVTGGWCVWLVVRDSIWNWPVGLCNATLYVIVFWRARLFADASLQVVYIMLGLLGWYMWLRGGPDRGRLAIRRVDVPEATMVAVMVVLSTWLGYVYLQHVNDAAPFLDALTTALSLGAQYLLVRKFIENWYVWLAVDLIYVGLYAARGLMLTSVLYFAYLGLALIGLQQWKRLLASPSAQAGEDEVSPLLRAGHPEPLAAGGDA